MEKVPEGSDSTKDSSFEILEIGGRKFRRVPSDYTIREYFSHTTPEKGPGPGWDSRMRLLEEEYARQHCKRTFSKNEVFEPTLLPDEPYYHLEPIEQ